MNYLKEVENLQPLITEEFLLTLILAIRICGWRVDHSQMQDFVEWCFSIIGENTPDIEPFDFEYNDDGE